MLINSWTAKHKCKHKLYWTTPDSTLDKSRVKNYDFVMSFKFQQKLFFFFYSQSSQWYMFWVYSLIILMVSMLQINTLKRSTVTLCWQCQLWHHWYQLKPVKNTVLYNSIHAVMEALAPFEPMALPGVWWCLAIHVQVWSALSDTRCSNVLLVTVISDPRSYRGRGRRL